MLFDKPRHVEIGTTEVMFDKFYRFEYSTSMNDTPQDAWFYSRAGERLGPVAFADLVIKAKEGGLNPRLDQVWKHGMDEWTPAGEIEGLFECSTASEPDDALVPAADPYATPGQDAAGGRLTAEAEWPGARRRTYLLLVFVIPILWNVLMTRSAPLLTESLGAEIHGGLMIGGAIMLGILSIVVSVRRLGNLGMSGWWFLGNLVPLLNFWVGYRCFACPAGYAYHKKIDGIGILLAIIYWGVILLAILAVAAVLALIFGAIGSPELQEQIRELIAKGNTMIPQK
jgi:uncharacterized membrane protein YhaH (DUF805 family)